MIDPNKNLEITDQSNVVSISVGFPTREERFTFGAAVHKALTGEQDYQNSNIIVNVEDKDLDGHEIVDECGQARALIVMDRAAASHGTSVEAAVKITKEDGSCIFVMQDGSTFEFSEDEENTTFESDIYDEEDE